MHASRFWRGLCVAAVVAAWPCLVWAQAPADTPAAMPDPDADAVPAVAGPFVDPIGPRESRYVSECEQVGGFTSTFQTNDRYRGDSFQMTETRELTEFKIQLQFTDRRNLYFSIHRASAPNGPYERLLPDRVVDTQGIGRTFYSSGEYDTPVTLEDGYYYALGVTWDGGTPQMIYGRNSLSYPRAFDGGLVRGGVSLSTAPPAPDTITYMAPYSGGAYSLEVCFLPRPGACCINDHGIYRCEMKIEGECLALSNPPAVRVEFTASGIDCTEVTCPLTQGACCIGTYPDVQCVGNRNEYWCAVQGGVWHAAESCPRACIPKGACCVGEMCLDEVTQAECTNTYSGVYQGDDSNCVGLALPCSAGACCLGTYCAFEDTEEECEQSEGSFAGPGTRCNQSPCTARGACCLSASSCADGYTAAQCSAAGGQYRGNDTACALLEVPCYLGACCTPTVGCVSDMSQSLCQTVLGTWQGEGTECDTSSSQCPGVCCWGGTCNAGVKPGDCEVLPNGQFIGYGTCAGDPCSSYVLGACCLPNGDCELLTDEVCVSYGGSYRGDPTCQGVDCTQPPPLGACCLTNGSCAITSSDSCDGQGGVFAGVGETCEVGLCVRGACCSGSGSCQQTVEFECATPSVFLAGTPCTPNPCDEFACCLNDESCVEVSTLSCLAQQGTQLPITNCEPFTCVAGACCEGGECAEETGYECDVAGGSFVPEATCTPDPCNVFACCLPGGAPCVELTPWTCFMQEGVPLDGYQCDSFPYDPCLGPCTTGDGDNDGDVDLQDFAYFQNCFGLAPYGGASTCECLDMNASGLINVDDVALFEAALVGP
ncbi:MAG TPA: hypothetical protein PKK06_03585 [Phycisphaerae bacterium]|nr:hypothetical protein [Phycisphaerae bacterium]HNU45361.1 hypothetical protein [Phycisphaerae bacterium]